MHETYVNDNFRLIIVDMPEGMFYGSIRAVIMVKGEFKMIEFKKVVSL